MLILQVIIGVVIGGIILANLGIVIGLALIVALGLSGLMLLLGAFSWISESPITIFILLAIMVVFIVWDISEKKVKVKSTAGAIDRLEKSMEWRDRKGYDTFEQHIEWCKLRDKLELENKITKENDLSEERKRRRSKGYDN